MIIDINQNFKGCCLVAMPNINSEIFNRSVIYLTDHNSVAGAVGVMINRDLSTGKKHFSNFSLKKYGSSWGGLPICFGGPVEYGTGFLLHQDKTTSEIQLTGSKSEITELALKSENNPLMMTSGYCLWESLQLEFELRANTWIVADDILLHLLKNISPRDRYTEALRLIGITSLANIDFSSAGNA